MSWTKGILIVFWLCVFSVSEASISSCQLAVACSTIHTICIEGSCECRPGYVPVSGECISSSITVSLLTQSTNVVYGSDVVLTATVTSELSSNPIKWLKESTKLLIAAPKYTQNGVGPGPVTLTIKNVNFDDTGVYQVEASNSAGTTSTSNQVSLTVTGGALVVTTGGDVTGRFGGNVTIGCTVTGPEFNKIQWKRHIKINPENIVIDGQKFTGGSVDTKALTIHSLTYNDALYQYQCTASNPGGVYPSANRAALQVKYGQFYEECSNSEPCDSSKYLTCMNRKCLCINTHYHRDQVCYPKTGIASNVIYLNSTTNKFSIFWNNPTTDYELVSGYEVNWRVPGGSWISSNRLGRTVNQYTASSNLISGQLYTVNVVSQVTLSNPAGSVIVTSIDRKLRTVPSAPGSIKQGESIFAHNNLQIKWIAPVNTLITAYEVTIDGTTYTTTGYEMYQFSGKVFVPGKSYVISIVTVSGTTDVKKSLEHTEWIRMIPTKPGPPTNLQCPQSPLDISLEISWTAPTEPNGRIFRYQIDVSPGNLQIYTSSNETHKNVEGLSSEQMYTFTVRTINDAVDNTSEPSQPLTCKTKAGVSTAPTNLKIDEVQSRRFRINFNRPENVNGILAAYKIVISEGENCIQQILVHGHCFMCMNTLGCPPPINYNVPDITNNDVSYTARGLMPYTHYMVKVVAINGEGEGRPMNNSVTTDEDVPLLPGQITAINVQSSSLTLAWTLPDPSPGNTTYTIYTYEGIDDIETYFLMKRSTKVNGFDTKTLSVTGLEEYWPYKFKVNAATVKGNKTSDFSSVFRTKQAAPGQVLNLTVQRKGNDFKSAYVSWFSPALRDHNGVLQSYLFSNNHTGTMKEEEISVFLSQSRVEKNISVIPESVYVIEVVLQNNESMRSQTSMQIYRAPAGPPSVTDLKPVTTKPGQHDLTEYTITIDINTEYFKNEENGKQVFFGVAVCAKSKCEDIGQNTFRTVWKNLPNWHKASTHGFLLYRITNDTFMDDIWQGDSRQRRSTINLSTLKFIIGEDATCPSLNTDVYCNGPLTAGTSYIVVIFACTNGGCTYYRTTEPFVTKQQPIVVTNYSPIIGSVLGVTLVVAVVVIGILLWKRNRRHKERNEPNDQANTYADLNLDERTKADQPYSVLENRSRTVKSKSVPLNSFFDYVVDLLRNNRQKLTKEYHDLLQYTERATSTVASSKNNVSKNRGNIIPYDFNRVKLCSPRTSDYINASVLLDKCYILTIYPIEKTLGNFWQMAWEQNVSTIVVITGQSDAKESWYFSDNEGTVLTIEKTDIEMLAKFKSSESVTMRKIKMSRGKHSTVVNHFHVISQEMTDLPDQILALINTVTENNVKNTGPQIVHGGCSGIDNSGVYIAVDHAVNSIVSGGKSIDVYGTAWTAMEERMLSISSLEQYSAIYTCLQKYLQNSPACTNDGASTYEYLP